MREVVRRAGGREESRLGRSWCVVWGMLPLGHRRKGTATMTIATKELEPLRGSVLSMCCAR